MSKRKPEPDKNTSKILDFLKIFGPSGQIGAWFLEHLGWRAFAGVVVGIALTIVLAYMGKLPSFFLSKDYQTRLSPLDQNLLVSKGQVIDLTIGDSPLSDNILFTSYHQFLDDEGYTSLEEHLSSREDYNPALLSPEKRPYTVVSALSRRIGTNTSAVLRIRATGMSLTGKAFLWADNGCILTLKELETKEGRAQPNKTSMRFEVPSSTEAFKLVLIVRLTRRTYRLLDEPISYKEILYGHLEKGDPQ